MKDIRRLWVNIEYSPSPQIWLALKTPQKIYMIE